MMLGRKEEMAVLEGLFSSAKFEFLVMYGRRRVGKTTILEEFARRHDGIFFPAQAKNDALNLRDFSETVQKYFAGEFLAAFPDWERALDYFGRQAAAGERRIVLIIDEFPFLAEQNPSLKSILQHHIDHEWQQSNIMLIICGSSVSFMISEVMGYRSPLYGRITSKLEVSPFDYLDSAAFFPGYENTDKLLAYGILGGIPRYLETFDDRYTIEENLVRQVLPDSSFLNDEPQMMLRLELREPGVYNAIMEAIANGANRLTKIADHIHEDRNKCNKYLGVLQELRLVRKIIPCGESESSKRGIYVLADFYVNFWYHFIFARRNYYAMMDTAQAAQHIMAGIPDYMGPVFEQVCQEYLKRMARKGALPFIPAQLGRWWGTNPMLHAQDDIDILGLDVSGKGGIFCECKYRNRPMPMEEYEDLLMAAKAFPKVSEQHFVFFSKGGFTRPVVERAQREGAVLLTLDDLYSLDDEPWRK